MDQGRVEAEVLGCGPDWIPTSRTLHGPACEIQLFAVSHCLSYQPPQPTRIVPSLSPLVNRKAHEGLLRVA
jgi:hypothetical protein